MKESIITAAALILGMIAVYHYSDYRMRKLEHSGRIADIVRWQERKQLCILGILLTLVFFLFYTLVTG